MKAPDRADVPVWILGGILVGAAASVSAGASSAALRGGHDPLLGLLAGSLVVILAVLGLPSVSLRLVARVMLVLSAVLLIRYGDLAGSALGGGQVVAAWAVGAVAVLVLTERVGRPGRPIAALRSVVVVTLAMLVFMAVVAPSAMGRMGRSAEPGDGPSLDQTADGPGAIRATDALDMTQRPELTDEVVLTIESREASFWRGQTFDAWDGRRWRQSRPGLSPVTSGATVAAPSEDLAAVAGGEVRQRVRVAAPYADLLFAAASPVRVTSSAQVLQTEDGALTTGVRPMGRGATYTVVSRRVPLTEERLRSLDGPVPPDVGSRYADTPVTTDRVRAAARRVTAGTTSTYDKVQALERWMGGRTEYSLDAPLSPEGVDVVDHFLFSSRQGWCEQVASSLVVLARSIGIPARLATGYVPDERDPITGTFVVRERDAHAWTEVWFPEVGWVAFDPTANVPLAGARPDQSTVRDWVLDHLIAIILGLVAIAVIVGPIARLVRRRFADRRGRVAPSWAATVEARLDDLGTQAERARAPSETATAYAAALAECLGEADLAGVGAMVDEARWAPGEVDPVRRDAVEAVLARPR